MVFVSKKEIEETQSNVMYEELRRLKGEEKNAGGSPKHLYKFDASPKTMTSRAMGLK